MADQADRLSVRGRWLGGALVLVLAMAAARAAIPTPPGPATQASNAAAPPPLLLGQSAPLSGPSGQLGQDYREGAEAWFAEVNRRGGIHGRPIRLVSRDDRYEPELTLRNTRQLLQQDRVLALFGYVGTPTSKAVLPLVERERVPFVAPLTGAQTLRQPLRATVFHLRAGYQAEIDQLVDALVRDARHRIAVLAQNDAFGDDGLVASERALARHGLKPVATARVERNSSQVGSAVATITRARPNGVIIIAAYPGSAAFSRELRRRRSTAQLMNVSFVGTRGLQDALPGGEASGIGVAQVVPFPWNRRLPVVADYQRLMQRRSPMASFGFTSLEGFLAARMITEGLQRAGPRPSREALMRGLESIRQLDLGGFTLDLGPKDREASAFTDLTFLGAQRWEP
ncbi:MAG: ABC transporter substrate-binding protein [Cyanobium sp. M30B3]|nr:MAG: ABC transporter substrate-binding protein [Cyanobium sp. M30B3]